MSIIIYIIVSTCKLTCFYPFTTLEVKFIIHKTSSYFFSFSRLFERTFLINKKFSGKNRINPIFARKLNYNIFYYRDRDKNEIDLAFEMDNNVYPFQIKKTATLTKTIFRILDINVGNGGLLCFYSEIIPIDEKTILI